MRTKTCSRCGVAKPLSEFSPHPSCRDGVRGTCKKCATDYAKAWQKKKRTRLRGFLHTLLTAAKHRAQCGGMPFELTLDYLVELWVRQGGSCAVSGLRFQYSRSKWIRNADALSLDRIEPKAGYVDGNVRFALDAVNVALNEWGLDTIVPIFRAVVKRHDGAT